MSDLTVTVLGLAYESPISQFPVRTGPGTSFDKAEFTVNKDTSGLVVLDVQPDADETTSDFGRVYNWFHLEFPNGQRGWLRDHIIGIEGDFSQFGYGFVSPMQHAYFLLHDPSAMQRAQTENNAQSAETSASGKAEPDVKVEVKMDTSNVMVEVTKDEEGHVDTNVTVDAAEHKDAPAAADIRSTTEARAALDEIAENPVEEVAVKRSHIMRPSDPPAVIIQRSPGSALNARDQPTTVGSSVLFTIPSREQVKLLDVEQTDYGQRFRWFKVEYSGRQAWVREDYCRVTGDTEALGLPWDLYPAPMADRSWWVRDYNYKPFQDTNVWEHWGWDFGAEPGTPILAGPYGGKVAQVMDCAKCTEQRPSTVLNGLALGDPSTLSDPGWGFGYGNFVVVGYKWDLLPDSTQNWMRENGYEDGSAFVLYGHLQSRNVEAGQSLHAEQIIGRCGNTGNSQAPHLHLELRLAKSDHYPGWASLMNGLTNPVVLFSR